MFALGIALGLGFIIGDSIRNLALALLACLAAAVLLTCGFVLLPYAWAKAPMDLGRVGELLLTQAFMTTVAACVGLLFGRRRRQKGWGKP